MVAVEEFAGADQQHEIATITSELDRSLRGILNQTQQQRLDQLRRQALGTRMFTQPDVIESLEIDPKVVAQLNDAFCIHRSEIDCAAKPASQRREVA